MPTVHTGELSALATFLEAHGLAFTHPAVRARYEPLVLAHDTHVDATLDPFSDAYCAQQIALYREIAGRELDQVSGELHTEDHARLVTAPNPTGIADARIVAEYVRCVATLLSLSVLGGAPHVLDLGAGHGLGSEIFAYAGCAVRAIDIDPGLGTLARTRAAALHLDITRTDMNFDDLTALPDGGYDAAFFFQALHHALRPWELIGALKAKLKPGGVIGFVGEPIQDEWPGSWGVRMDIEALYVARARGWFESSWSHAFLRRCFARSGMTLTLFTGGYLGGEIGIATADAARRDAVIARAQALGLRVVDIPRTDGSAIADDQFASASGEPTILLGRPAFRQDGARDGALIHGPYATLSPGTYEANLFAQHRSAISAGSRRTATLEVTCDGGDRRLFRCRIAGTWTGRPRAVTQRFTIPEPVSFMEVRIFAPAPGWIVSIPLIRKVA